MRMKFILSAFIVIFGLTYAQPYNEIADQFQNLFNSIAENDSKNKEISHQFLRQEVRRERQAFDTMKNELRVARNKNSHKVKMNFIKKREVSTEAYTFPKIEDGNAIEAVKSLLDSQRTAQKEIDRLFREICRKNKNHSLSDLLERSIDRFIEMADELITNTTEVIEAYEKNGSATDYFKRKPMTYKTARLLIDCWKYVDDFITNYVKQWDFDLEEEIKAMRKPVDNAIRELEEYHKYVDIVYEQTGIYRDETEFQYPKYGRLKPNMTTEIVR